VTFQASAAPTAFEGWTTRRMRNAIALHDQGFFFESYLLAQTCTRFGPVFAALRQAIAPAVRLPRKVTGGTVGLSRQLRAEYEMELCPRDGLVASPYFPVTLWGELAIEFSLMGFAVMQHVYGDPDPDTGVRHVWTRRWPTWATVYYPYRRTLVAQTNSGPVDIIGDGKFTIVADREEIGRDGAVRALGAPVMSGALVQMALDNYIDRYGNPHPDFEMPPGIGPNTKEGESIEQAIKLFQRPDGLIVRPNGSKFSMVQLDGRTSSVFKDAGDKVWAYVAAIMLGTDGTLSVGTGGAAYRAPGFWGVAHTVVARMLSALVRGVNAGHIHPSLMINYAEGIAAARARGIWTEPALEIPFADPDTETRIASYAGRVKLFFEIVKMWREEGFIFGETEVESLAGRLDIDPPTLAPSMSKSGEFFEWMVNLKLVAPDEVRAWRGLPALPGDVGSLDRLAEERLAGKDQTGLTKIDETATGPETAEEQAA